MHFRPATTNDVDVLVHHRVEMFREMGGEYASNLGHMAAVSREYFLDALPSGAYFSLLVEQDGAVVAGGGVAIAPWPGSPHSHEPKRAWILNMYVEPVCRRRGLARQILNALIDWCRERGFPSVSLHASDAGRPLYAETGFTATNEMRLQL